MQRLIVEDENGALSIALVPLTKGGRGSGNFGHSGRPGYIGGSSGGGGGVRVTTLRNPAQPAFTQYQVKTEDGRLIYSTYDQQEADDMASTMNDAFPEGGDAETPESSAGTIDFVDVDIDTFKNVVQPWIDDNARNTDGSIDQDKAGEALWMFADKTNIPSGTDFPEEWSQWLDEAVDEMFSGYEE